MGHGEEDALIENEISPYTQDGSVDINGKPVLKTNAGNWKACPFILGSACCERLAYYGISLNLVSYLTTKLHQGNVSAARNVTTWQGTCYLTPFIGAVFADSYWGRYWTITVFSVLSFIGMCILTFSAFVPFEYAFLFTGLYLVALGSGGIQSCVSSFGADQFDDTDLKESVEKGSFFNWFFLSTSFGVLVSTTIIVWIQQNTGWGFGFGILVFFVGLAIVSFVLGTPVYRFHKPQGSPITRICQVLVAAFHKRNLPLPIDSSLLFESPLTIDGSRRIMHTDELKYLDKAAVVSSQPLENPYSNPWTLCSVTHVEEVKILINMFPIWATGIAFSAVYAQMSTMFVEQGMAMNTNIGSFTIPAASLTSFNIISAIFWIPIYDKIIIPVARNLTGQERGFSELQRMGIGLFLAIFCMGAAALVEITRLDRAKSLGLVNQNVAVPMSVFWQAPQYFVLGAAEVFYVIGQTHFFYDQSPDAMRSLCSAFSLLTTALGNYLSSFILTVVTFFTARDGKPGWIPDNLNEGRLDCFFFLLAGLSFLNLLVFIVCAKVYKSKSYC